jgi:hypothetical protein
MRHRRCRRSTCILHPSAAQGGDAVAAVPAEAETGPEEAAEKKRVPIMEEARMQVRAAVHNWVLDSVGERIGLKPR